MLGRLTRFCNPANCIAYKLKVGSIGILSLKIEVKKLLSGGFVSPLAINNVSALCVLKDEILLK